MLWAGKVSGARFIGGASSGFDAGTIILRGAGSIPSSSQSDNPANEPIYVVDGAITNKNSINMDDVESINVLKGPCGYCPLWFAWWCRCYHHNY